MVGHRRASRRVVIVNAEPRLPPSLPSVTGAVDGDAWREAADRASVGLSAPARRARLRNARSFAAWCVARDLDPGSADKATVELYISALQSVDRQAPAKVKCDLRKVMQLLDPERARRVVGLGRRTTLLGAYQDSPVGRLLSEVVGRPGNSKREAVRRSALATLFTWADEVGIEPTDIGTADLPQFREWLREIGSHHGETMVVAKDYVELRHSSEGRSILGEPEPALPRIQIGSAPALQPRFEISEVQDADPMSVAPKLVFVPAIRADEVTSGRGGVRG